MSVQTLIQIRRGTAAQWNAAANSLGNGILYQGEIGYETDTGRFKVGDGTTHWASGLRYAAVVPTGFIGGSGINMNLGTNGSTLTVAVTGLTSSYIGDFNSAVNAIVATGTISTENVMDIMGTGLVGRSGIAVDYQDASNVIYLSVTGINSSQVTNFNSAVSGILPSVSGASGVAVSFYNNTNTYVVGLNDPTIQVADITDFVDGVNDRVANLLTQGTGIKLTYTDNNNATSSLRVDVTGVSLSGHVHTSSDITDFNSAVSGLIVVKQLTASTGIGITNVAGNHSIAVTGIASTLVTDFQEAVQDVVGVNAGTTGFLRNGSGIAWTYDDAGNTLTANSTGLALSSHTHLLSAITDVTATAAEVNYNDLSVGPGTVEASKTVVVDANKDISNFRNVGVTGTLTATNISSAGTSALGIVTTTGNLTVGANLIVNGTTTTVNSTTVTIDDPIFTLGGDTAPVSDDNKDRGIEFRWYSGSAKVGFFGFDDSTGKFTFIPDATNTSEVFSGTKGELDASVDWTNILNKPDPIITGILTGDVTGTGTVTLTDLANGSLSIAATIAPDSVALGTDTTGNYVAAVAVSGTGLTLGGSAGEGVTFTVISNATPANVASSIVARDANGNFSAGIITGTAFSGTHSGDGSALTNLNASNISTGTLAVARLPTGIPVTNLASSGITLGTTTINLGQTSTVIDGLTRISGVSAANPVYIHYAIIDGGTP